MSTPRSPRRDGNPELAVRIGDDASARVILVLRLVRDRGHYGTIAERVPGPWLDPAEARQQLHEVHGARQEDGEIHFDWVSVAGADVVAAFIEDDSQARALTRRLRQQRKES